MVAIVGIYFYMDMRHPIKQHSVYTYSPLLIQEREAAPLLDEVKKVEGPKTLQLEAPEGWKIYTNSIDGYSLLYPESWHILVCSNGYYEGNVNLSSKPIENLKCVAETMDEAAQPEISISTSCDTSVGQFVETARRDAGFIAEFIEKSTEINGKTYPQMLTKLKIIPPWFIPSTTGVTTFVEISERQKIVSFGMAGLDDDSENANVYRQIISSLKILDTPKPENCPKL